ncbi:bifunctional GNAT family N-acetyltransferase/NUDIX hydrolase [Angustibacter luteus]|uniref:Bifunctional GNAT family N-acetyltransferase/NUDIX hydrolase n=1 Tax=Angustibacter luteus TaxID=658456 RepID=A0ABW1J9Q0_9ACTN
MSADDLGALGTTEVQDAVAALLGTAVGEGAALGWVEPPEADDVRTLLTELGAAGRRGDADVVLAWDGGTLVGFGYWRRYARPTHRPQADLERVVVVASHRGRGLGRELVDRLVSSATDAGIETLTLDVRGDNASAIALYERAGFRRYGVLPDFVAFGDRRWDKVLMMRRLQDGPEAEPTSQPRSQSARTDHLVAWAVLQRADGWVLLGRRAGVTYGNGLWGLPGGHVEDHESMAEAAAREVAEEVGLVVAPSDLTPIGVTRYVDGAMRGTSFFFRARRWQGDPAAVSECSAVDWFDPERLPDDALPWLAATLGRHLSGDWLDDQP